MFKTAFNKSLGRDFFLRGVVLWHPKILTLFCLLKFCQELKLFHLSRFTLLLLWIFTPSGNFQKVLLDLYALFKKTILYQGIYWHNCFSELYSFKMIFQKNLEPVLHCNHLTNAFKISTKIWGCHVMVPHHFYAKISFGRWGFWALHQLFKSGPVGIFALQPI